MRHHHKGRSLSRPKNQRQALLRSLARSLVIHERISTTEAKARELRPFMEKLVTRAKADTVANRRLITARIQDADATKKLFVAIGPRYKERAGGYTRIVKRAKRGLNDARKLAYIAFV
ncbi:MAG: 50S ribosomal protein L17 [Minisyncoccia bacterium]